MRKPKSKHGLYGYTEGKDAAHDTDWQDGELKEKYENDSLGEVAGQILENWRQTAGTIYYDDVSDDNLDRFENGFSQGFCEEATKLAKAIPQTFEDTYCEGDLKLDHIPDVKESREILRGFKARNYFPNVFHVNDHGNVDLLYIGYNGAKIVQSWV